MAERIPTRYVSSMGVLVASQVVSAVPCKVMSLLVKLDETAPGAGWVQLHEAAALPANAALPFFPSVPLQPGQIESIEVGAHGIDLAALTVALSSTHPALTIGGAYLEVIAVVLG